MTNNETEKTIKASRKNPWRIILLLILALVSGYYLFKLLISEVHPPITQEKSTLAEPHATLSTNQLTSQSTGSQVNACSPGAEDVFLQASTAYIVAGNCLRIVDVSNVNQPRQIADSNVLSHADGIYVSGAYAYVADWQEGLIIIDVSNRAVPKKVGGVKLPGPAWCVFVKSSYAFVTVLRSGVHIIDISNPMLPKVVATYTETKFPHDIYLLNQYAYVQDSVAGLKIVDVTNPLDPRTIGGYKAESTGLYVDERFAYLADRSEFMVIDVRNAAAPKKISSYKTSNTITQITVQNHRGYVIEDVYELDDTVMTIIDLKNPYRPKEIGGFSQEHRMKNLKVMGPNLFIASGEKGLEIYDVNNPDQLWVLSQL